MKSRDQVFLEAAYRDVIHNSELKKLITRDYNVIDELIEEGFGDYLKTAGNYIKGGAKKAASKIKETLTSSLAGTLVNTIVSSIPKQELENFVNIIAKGQVPKEKIEQVKGIMVQQPANNSVKESWLNEKQCLAEILFTESTILSALQNTNSLLVEARAGRELQKYAKEVANKINELYPKNKKAMAAAIPKFTNLVSKQLGIQSTDQQPAEPVAEPPKPTNQENPWGDNTKPLSMHDPRWGEPGIADKVKTAASGAMSKIKGAAKNIENKMSTGNGLTGKIMQFIKAHPKISAAAGAVLLGLVVAAFAGSAPVIVPALTRAVVAAGITGTTTIVKQLMSGEQVDLKAAGKAAAIGGAIGGVGGILAQGLGVIASQITPQEFVVSNTKNVNGETVTDKITAGKRIPLGGLNYEYDVASNDNLTGDFKHNQSGFNVHKKM